MLKIGVTGGIGSGKTTVCKIFETLGIPVFYADAAAKELMVRDVLLIHGVKKVFGEESYLGEGILNNKHIAQIVFNDPAELDKLNAMVHPAVFRAFKRWADGFSENVPYVLKEAALLFESDSYKMCNLSILVTAPHAAKLDRVIKRDQVSEEQVIARMDKQFSDEEKEKMADFLILNNETQSVILQVLTLHQRFLNIKR